MSRFGGQCLWLHYRQFFMAETLMSAFKGEITRLARKVVKSEVASLQSASTSHRRQIAALKRQVAELEKQVRQLGKGVARVAAAASTDSESEGTTIRFQARGLKTLRAKLGLSAEDLGRLAGVTGQSIYNWEAGKAKPRPAQATALARLRGIGKKEAKARLEALSQKG